MQMDRGADAEDSQDMRALQAGQDEALNRLMDRHLTNLFRFALRLLQNEADATEVAQDTFVRIYQHRAQFDLAKRFTTWMYQIGSNLATDRFRWRSRHPEASLEAIDSGPSASFDLVGNASSPADLALK